MTEQDEQRIRDRAHQMWLDDGCPDDRALDYWLAAERELLGAEAENLDAAPLAVPEIVRTGKAKMLDGPHIREERDPAANRRGEAARTKAGAKRPRQESAGPDLGRI